MSENSVVREVKIQWVGIKKNGKWALLEGDDKAGEKQTWFNKGKDYSPVGLEAGKTYRFIIGTDAHHINYINGIEGETPKTAPECQKPSPQPVNLSQNDPKFTSFDGVSKAELVMNLSHLIEEIGDILQKLGAK